MLIISDDEHPILLILDPFPSLIWDIIDICIDSDNKQLFPLFTVRVW